jgi:polysaccharide deacetylase family protein (PEP-CTERM system associated)
MKNILTFDIEEWYDVNYPKVDVSKIDSGKSNLGTEVRTILDLCAKHKTKATFFVLGRVAERNPWLIKEIRAGGHEIACHGYDHKLVYNLSPQEFKEDLGKAVGILESIIGKKVLGYRAPSWSFNEKTSWAYPILSEMGLKYSASVFPVKTFIYGLPNSPRLPYKINNILEIPTSTIRLFNKNIPFSGGFYLRFWPTLFVKKAIRELNKKGQPTIIYLHPREIDPSSPELELPLKEKLIQYWAVSKTKDKLENILKNYEFGSIESELLPKYLL